MKLSQIFAFTFLFLLSVHADGHDVELLLLHHAPSSRRELAHAAR